uniref:RRM domain-containing protein n=1 Tax=Trichogramma kaykai TaxID=54128 RepID=A0ABD2XM52_9HYME
MCFDSELQLHPENSLYEDMERELQINPESEAEMEKKKLQELIQESATKEYLERNLGAVKETSDERSIYVGNVDYSATVKDLEKHFSGCGPSKLIHIVRDRYNMRPKGYAYIEFAEQNSVNLALAKNKTLFLGRILTVMPKKTFGRRLGRYLPPYAKHFWPTGHRNKFLRPPSAYKWTRTAS